MQKEYKLPAIQNPDYAPFHHADGFLGYLIDPAAPLVKLEQMPNRIDAGYFSDYFSALYSDVRTVPTLDERMLSDIPNSSAIDPNSLAGKHIERLRNTPMLAERSSVVYQNLKTHFVDMTQPRHGTGFHTTMMVRSVIDDRNLPILTMHTHPTDSFFSAEDFDHFGYSIIRSVGLPNRKLFKATAVLCPNVQILAMITRDTPEFVDYSDFKNRGRGKSFTQENEAELEKTLRQIRYTSQNGDDIGTAALKHNLTEYIQRESQANAMLHARAMNMALYYSLDLLRIRSF